MEEKNADSLFELNCSSKFSAHELSIWTILPCILFSLPFNSPWKCLKKMDSCALWRQCNLCSHVSFIESCAQQRSRLCFVSPLCEDFDVAVIVLELDCTVEWVISTDHRPWVSLQFLSQIIAALFAFLVCIDYYCEVTRGSLWCCCQLSWRSRGGGGKAGSPCSQTYQGPPKALLDQVYWIKI